jgi:hypothetical protein
VDNMTDTSPTPQEARAALDEANSRAATVRRADSRLRLILWILAALYLATGALLSGNPRQGSVLIGDALIVIFLGGLAGTVYVMWRIRAWSRMGIVWLLGSVAVFLLWNGAVIWVSIATGWWGPDQPGIHFGGSVVVAVIPLLVAGWLVGRR